MSTFKKKIIGLIAYVLLADMAIAVWVLAHDIKTQFSDLDLSRARFGIASWYNKKDAKIKPETANDEKFSDKK